MKGIWEWEDLSGYDYYLAVFNFFSFNMAVRWLSFVDGYYYAEIKTKIKIMRSKRLFLSWCRDRMKGK